MNSVVALQPEPAPVAACTVSRDVCNFDLLISDMETEMGERWGDLSFADALAFLDQPDARALEFLAIAIDASDEADLELVTDLVAAAKEQAVKVILIASSVSPGALHRLMRCGADDFLPYPLPDGALHESIEKTRRPDPPPAPAISVVDNVEQNGGGGRNGALLAVHGIAGGVGATTFAVNLAWECASHDAAGHPRICLLDLDLQTGSVATYLDLPRRDIVSELLSDAENLDSDSLLQSLQLHGERLHVLTAPADMMPLDILSAGDVEKIISIARQNFDIVIIDMPKALVGWTETVLQASDIYFAMMELDMRSAQNTLRFIRLLKSEELPIGKVRFTLNRAPSFANLQAKSRVRRMADSLDIRFDLMLPDGQKQVIQACDHGLPLAENAGKNPLRKEISKLAGSLHGLLTDASTGR